MNSVFTYIILNRDEIDTTLQRAKNEKLKGVH